MKKNLLLCLLFLFSLWGCRQKSINDILEQMEKYPVQMSLDQMICVTPDSVVKQSHDTNGLKMVVFADTTDCSLCYIDHLKQWNDLLSLETKYQNLSFYFMVEARKNEGKSLSNLLHDCGLFHTAYIDTSHVFLRENPHVDVPSAFHTFLLDEDNRVILVGNPLTNPNIEKLLIEILEASHKQKRSATKLQ